jgi:uncharacterized protein (DUF952 family)
MTTIVHITTRSEWDKAQRRGSYEGDTLDTEGFIHMCEPHQLLTVAERFYKGHPGLVLLIIDSERVRSPLRYEPNDNDHFPHLYGALNLDAVLQVVDFIPNASGRFEMPERLTNV